jgi:hypothetical protein
VFPWLQCRKGEWVRRFGASLPMRMTASWFGSSDPPDTRLWRDRSRPQAGSPLVVIPIALSVPSCSKPSRCGLATAEPVARLVRRPTLTAPARAAVSKARIGTKKRAFKSNKETDDEKRCADLSKLLDKPHTRKPREGVRGRGGALQWGLGSSFRAPTVTQLQRSGMSVAKWGFDVSAHQ